MFLFAGKSQGETERSVLVGPNHRFRSEAISGTLLHGEMPDRIGVLAVEPAMLEKRPDNDLHIGVGPHDCRELIYFTESCMGSHGGDYPWLPENGQAKRRKSGGESVEGAQNMPGESTKIGFLIRTAPGHDGGFIGQLPAVVYLWVIGVRRQITRIGPVEAQGNQGDSFPLRIPSPNTADFPAQIERQSQEKQLVERNRR
jgi:hypothetical protein